MAEVTPPLMPLVDGNTSPVRQSYAQRRFWFLYQMSPEIAQHNIVFRLSLTGAPLCLVTLSSALAHIMHRHSVFRTGYRSTTEQQEQWVNAHADVELNYQDITNLSPQSQTEALVRILSNEQHTVFDLYKGAVLRALLVSIAHNRQELIFTVHHIAFDGRSLELFVRELAHLYGAKTTDQLPSVALQYRDFAAWEPRYITPSLIETEIAFWRDYVADTPTQMEFIRYPRREGALRAARHYFLMPTTQVDRLRAAAKTQDHSLFTLLVGLFGVWMHHLSGQDRFLLGTDVHGRDFPELADIMGFFVNQLTIKCDLTQGKQVVTDRQLMVEHDNDESANDLTLAELLNRAHTNTVSALAHRALPFDLLVSALAPPRQSERMPLFQVKLNYQRYQFPIAHIGESRIVQTHTLQDMAGFDLVLDLTHGPTGIEACLEYDEQRFSKPEIERFAHLWSVLIAQHETLRDQPLSSVRQQLQLWENEHFFSQQQAQNQNNRARLQAAARNLRTPQAITLQENS